LSVDEDLEVNRFLGNCLSFREAGSAGRVHGEYKRARGEMPDESNESLIGRTTVEDARRFPKDAKR
jgi:hypothetical protein